jgi:DNA-binding SARP family transcriptional activator
MPRRQVRALLYRLAAEAQPVGRDSLCFLFWPDARETVARHNLSRLLTLLHHSLPDPAILNSHDDRIELRRACLWSDTRALLDLHAAWRADGLRDALRQAADLYRGPFLDGFSLPDSPEFDLWASQQRERWERLALQMLAALVDALALDGDYAGAIAYAQRALAIDELAEDVQRRLMELYALAGQRSAALRQYERCITVLERDLGVDPAPETQAVYRALLRGDALATRPAAATPVPPAARNSETPLLGRAAELKAMDEAFCRAWAGRGGALLLSGEPGIGKSRLLAEFAGRVRRKALLVSGCCYAETVASPYQPLIEALRPHLTLRCMEFDAYPVGLSNLAQVFPELRSLHPGLPQGPSCEPGWARTRLFEALETLLLHLAHGIHPVVLSLDNLHWADSATVDWLAYLGRHLADRPILLVGAYRREPADPLAALRAGLAQQGALVELALEGLDAASVGELVQYLGRALPSDPALAGRLRQATGGNPFYLLETLASLGAEQAADGAATEWPLATSVCQAVQRRIDRLSPTARQVLEAAAVLGPAAGCEALRLTAGRGELELADALDELAAQQFVLQEPGSIRFRHEIVAGVVYRGLSAYRRQLLHRRAGEALQRVQPDAAAALARHCAAAGLPGQAARYAVQAGLAAKQVFAHAEARSHFDQALALLAQEAAGLHDAAELAENRRLRIRALGERGWALRLLGDMDAYSRDLDEEARLAGALDDPAALARLRWRHASAQLWFCRYGAARAAAEDGLRLSRAAGDEFLQAACLRALGLAARECGDYDLAQRSLELALEGFARLDQPSLRLHTLGNLSTLALYQGDPARALELARQALAVSEGAGLTLDRRLSLGDIGAAAAALGDVKLARQSLEESLAIARQVSDRTQEILCLGHLGWLAVQEGQATPAVEHLRAALALAEQVDSCAEQAWLHAGLAEALRLAGDADGAAAHAQQAVDLAEATGQAHSQRLAQQAQARVFAHEPAPAVVDC